ncbi:hypothetical protein M3C63_06545 [Brevibacterium luteolum]|uniref:hypothetical protein n=1 Tax=Brevibacterium luteolum TaxID=199591 RepID=UPI00223A7E22|nr:hypothetical protein [Brevibacterium luteolum]MCT1921515.1 hypothetical protein [Brevibacterium luteolum]
MNRRTTYPALALTAVAVLGLSACGAKEYDGKLLLENNEPSHDMGSGSHSRDTIKVKCEEKGGVITATVTESKTGNTFTTTQPEGGTGWAGGTLVYNEGNGEEFTWEVKDGIETEDDIMDARSSNTSVFTGENQEGTPLFWMEDGTFNWVLGGQLIQHTTRSEKGYVSVALRGGVDCSNGGE